METTFLFCSVLVILSALIFESGRTSENANSITLPASNQTKRTEDDIADSEYVMVVFVIGIVVLSTMYFGVVLLLEMYRSCHFYKRVIQLKSQERKRRKDAGQGDGAGAEASLNLSGGIGGVQGIGGTNRASGTKRALTNGERSLQAAYNGSLPRVVRNALGVLKKTTSANLDPVGSRSVDKESRLNRTWSLNPAEGLDPNAGKVGSGGSGGGMQAV